ncbi:MAG: DUF4131 domain-containing protein, partial [Desulfobacterales bacterium]|nr:DUF4131 domain-containing protein [Desulfobacterales bacterium]
MSHRPLIPILLSFIAGILVSTHGAFPAWPGAPLLISFCIAVCLFIVLFLSSRASFPIILLVFFLSGILLNIQEKQSSRLLPFASRRDKVTIEGTVLEPVKINDKIAKLKVSAHGLFIDGEAIQVNENIMVTVYNHIPDVSPGEKIRFPARLSLFKNFNNPGRYDYELAMKLKKVTCAASVSDGRHIVPMGPGHMPFPNGLLERFRRPIRDFFEEKLGAQGYALYRALILGERQGIGSELREPFNQTGLGHVLAVSGLHIGLVAWLAFFFFKGVLSWSYSLALKTDIRKLAAIMTCLPVLGYTFVAGFQVSSQRAMIMALAFLCSLILGRGREIWSTLALAGVFVLALDPQALFSISFQLSFSAVIGILWLTPAFLAKLPHSDDMKPGIEKIFYNKVSYYLIGLVAVSLSATIILLPQISMLFHRIPLVTIPANVTVTPILGLWVIPLGLLSVVSLPLSSGLANFFLCLGAWGLNVMMEIVRFWADLSWSSFWVIMPNLFEMFLFYALIFLLFFFRRWPWVKVGGLVLVVFILADMGYWVYREGFTKELRITFIDVGQGNSALLEFPEGKKMLIDGGGFPRDHFDVGKMVVAPYLWHSKISSIDY